MNLCFSGATTMQSSLFEDLDACAAAGWPEYEVWLTKLETCLRDRDIASIREYAAQKSIRLAAASYQGGLLLSQGEQRKAHFEHFQQRLALCEALGIRTMLIVADFARSVQPQDLERAVVSLRQASQWAAGFGVTLALEFRGADAFCASLDTAVSLVEHAGETNLGVCLDLFHYHKGPSKLEDLDSLPLHRLAFLQVCDVAGVPREIMSDSDRVLPGDGDFPLSVIVKKLGEIGYDGSISVELFNPQIWQLPAIQVADLAMAAMNRLLKRQ